MKRRLWRFSAAMALADLRHEPASFAFQVLALAAVLSPLLVLYGLKYGVVSTLTEQLRADPAVRQVQVVGSGHFDEAWFEQLAKHEAVGFIMPHTRALSAVVDFSGRDQFASGIVSGVVMATARGDPMLKNLPAPATNQAVISAELAQKLNLTSGDSMRIIAVRNKNDRRERVLLPVSVAAVMPVGDWETAGALIHLDALVWLEQWLEGYAVPELDWHGDTPPAQRHFPTFRLYAKDIESVRALAEHLTGQGLRVRTELQRIQTIRAFDRSLGLIFLIIAVIAGAGFLLSFGASLWANVLRKRRQLSILRLQGLARRPASAFPMTQSLTIAFSGWVVGTLLYMMAALAINASLGQGLMLSGSICRLTWHHHLTGVMAVMTVALLASIASARRITRLNPAEGINHG